MNKNLGMNIKRVCLTVYAFLILWCPFCYGQKSAPKVALVLSGGGANGLAEIPLLEALEEEGIVPDLVIGVSMGSIIASLYCSGYTPKEIRTLLTEMDIVGLVNQSSTNKKLPPSLYGMNYHSNFASLDFSQKGFGSQPGLVGDQKITTMLSNCLLHSTPVTNFDKLKIPLRIICTDVFTGDTIICDHGSIITSIRASMAVPLVFSPFPTGDGHLGYDGGLSNNLPIKIAKELGADTIIAMDVLGKIGVSKENFSSINSTFIQSINLIIAQNTMNQYPDADILIRPELSALSAGNFGNQKEIIAIGEKAVNEHKEEIKLLAQKLKQQGKEITPRDYNRLGEYSKIKNPTIQSVSVKDISFNSTKQIPKSSEFSFFIEKELNGHMIKLLNRKLDELCYTYNLSTLTYTLKEISPDLSLENKYELEILANHYDTSKNCLFVGGHPALECSFSNSESPKFIMLPFFTAGLIWKDFFPLCLIFSTDRFFSANLEVEPVLYKNRDFTLSLNFIGEAKYGTLSPANYLTYSTLLADDDFGASAQAGIKTNLNDYLVVQSGAKYDYTRLHKIDSSVHNLYGYIDLGAGTLKDETTGLQGIRTNINACLGTGFTENLIYKFNVACEQNFEVIPDKMGIGYFFNGGLNSFDNRLLDGWTDISGFNGLAGYGYGSFYKNYAVGGLCFKYVLLNKANLPLTFITQTSLGLLQTDNDYSLDTGINAYLAFHTPVGNILLGGGGSFIGQKWSFSISFR